MVGTAEVVVAYNSAAASAELKANTRKDMAGLSEQAAAGGMLAGGELRKGVKDGAAPLAEDLGKIGEDSGVALKDNLGKGTLSVAENLLGTVGFSMDGIHERGNRMASAAEKGGLSIRHMSENAGLSEAGFVALGGGLLAGAAGAVDLGLKSEEATTKVANSAQISEDAAGKITAAFTGMAGKSENDGAALAQAYAAVAGQLGSMQGRALTAAEAVKVMTAAQNLSEASGQDLASTTQTLATVMQAYHMPVKNAADVTDQLYTAGNRTGLGVAGLGAAVAKVKTGLGDMAPPLSETSGLLVDMANHGETGRKGLSLLTTAMTVLVKPASDMAVAQNKLKIASDALPPSLRQVAAEYTAGKISATDLTKVADKLGGQQRVLLSTFVSAADGMTTARQASDQLGFSTVDAKGKFIGIGPVLEKLHDQVKGMSDEQATAKLTADGFGTGAAKMLAIVKAGPQAFNEATDAVKKHGAAAEGAAKQQGDLGAKAKIFETDIKDLGEELGAILVPALEDVVGVGMDVVSFFEKDKTAAEALGVAVGVGLAIPVARFAGNTAKDFVGSLEGAGKSVINFGAKLTGNAPVFAATQTEAQQTASAMSSAASSMAGSATRIEEALSGIGGAAGGMAASVEAETAGANTALESTAMAADTAATGVGAGLATIESEVTGMAATVEAENEAAGMSFADLIPGVAILSGVGLLASQFLNLGGSEDQEAAAAQRVTSAKHAEASAITDAKNALLASESGYLGVQAAQQQVQSTAEAATAATKKYGVSSLQAREAVTQHKEAVVQLDQAQQQQTTSQQNLTAKSDQAVSKAHEQVTATNTLITAIKDHIQSLEDERFSMARTGDTAAAVKQRNQDLQAATRQLTAAEQQRTTAEQTLQGTSAQAAANTLNLARSMDGLPNLTAAVAGKVSTLGDSLTKLPRDVQMRIAGDSTDAQEKISGVLTQLQAAGIGPTNPQVLKILGDSTNAQQALRQLTGLLDSLPAEFRTVGQQASMGLAEGITAGIPVIRIAAAGASNAATVTARDTLKTHSPSQVFHDIGTDVGAGLAAGIEGSVARVKGSTKRLLGEIRPAAALDLPNLEPVTGPHAASTLTAAGQAPTASMAAAEQVWVTGAQTVVTGFTTAAQAMASKASAEQAKASGEQAKASGDQRSAAADQRQANADQKRAALDDVRASTEKSVAAKKTELAAAAQATAAAKTALSAQAVAKAGADLHGAAATTDRAAAGVQRSAEAKDKLLEATASKGQVALNTMLSAIASKSQSQLSSAMSGITEKQMTAMVGKLDGTHKKALAGMASEIETTWKQGMKALALSNEIAANTAAGTAATDAANSAAKITADNAALSVDAINSAIPEQVKLDQDTLTTDTTIGNDQATLDQAAPGSLAESQAQLQLTKDQAGQTTTLAGDNAALSIAQATLAAAQSTATNTGTIAAAAAAAPATPPTMIFNLSGSGQTTTADWVNEIGIAMTIGTLPPAVANPNLPGNQALVAA